jgi:hypothetical protein
MAIMVTTVLRNVGGNSEETDDDEAGEEQPQMALAYLGEVD